MADMGADLAARVRGQHLPFRQNSAPTLLGILNGATVAAEAAEAMAEPARASSRKLAGAEQRAGALIQ
jgi:hypothetical protein